MTDLINIAKKILSEYYLCIWCLGRLFGGLSTGLSNKKRGEIIIEYIKMDIHYRIISGKRIPRKLINRVVFFYGDEEFNSLMKKYGIRLYYYSDRNSKCYICNNLFEKINVVVEKVYKKISKYEFDTFLVGVQQMPEVEKREEEIKRRYGIWFGENIRNELSREIGKALAKRFNAENIDRKYISKSPDIIVVIDLMKNSVEINSKNMEITLNAVKMVKDAPIFSTQCPDCRGGGCDTCLGTGRGMGDSFETLIGLKLLDIFGGERWKFGIRYIDKEKGYFKAKFRILNPHRRDVPEDILDILNVLVKDDGFKLISINVK